MRTETGSRRIAPAAALMVAVFVSGCGTKAHHPQPQQASLRSDAPAPVVVSLALELPLIGLSGASQVSYTTGVGATTLRGSVQPAGTTVYMLDAQGRRTVVNPRARGDFDVPAKLMPGVNRFQFTAARLGVKPRTASLNVSWRGPAADHMQALIAADPAKYLPPASAGLNRKLPPLGNIPAIVSGTITATFSINPILASPPPPIGGPGKWLGGFELTEYYPALEAWFQGALVDSPGLGTQHRIDWLYSAHGLSMEGDGIGLDGKPYHVANLGSGGWLTAGGGGTAQFGAGSAPFWRTGGFWRSATGTLTFPLSNGGWSAGTGVRYVPPPGITFAPGQSRPLSYLRSVATDPSVIPMGSHIFIPSYQSINGGWFEADDTGGAIIGNHIDVFRPPPRNPADTGNFSTGQQVYVVPPGVPLP
jgi:3D (Asp-Asp-Asp) domain-containing protein